MNKITRISCRSYSSINTKLGSCGYMADSFSNEWDMKKNSGSYMYDVLNERYLDFHGGYGSNPIGWNHPKLVERMKKVDISAIVNKPANGDFYTEYLYDYVETFKKTLPESYNYLFFIDGGALAVENALKVAMDWKTKLVGRQATDIIHFERAFHGRSGYTLSLTNTDPVKTKYFAKFNGWPRLRNANDIESVIEERGKENIAALIVEPIRCEGGDIYFTPQELHHLQSVCRQNDILFIVDEVQTGFSTGRNWCFEYYNLTPDIVSFSKKVPGGIFGGGRLNEFGGGCMYESGRISSTFGGDLVSMIRSKHVLDIIEEDDLHRNATKQGYFWKKSMKEIAEESDYITNVRNLGLLMAFDVRDDYAQTDVLGAMKTNGLIGLSCGERTIRFRPNLCVTQGEMEECLDITRKTMKELF